MGGMQWGGYQVSISPRTNQLFRTDALLWSVRLELCSCPCASATWSVYYSPLCRVGGLVGATSNVSKEAQARSEDSVAYFAHHFHLWSQLLLIFDVLANTGI